MVTSQLRLIVTLYTDGIGWNGILQERIGMHRYARYFSAGSHSLGTAFIWLHLHSLPCNRLAGIF